MSLEPLLEALEASSEGKAAAAAVGRESGGKRSAAVGPAAPAPAAPYACVHTSKAHRRREGRAACAASNAALDHSNAKRRP